MIVGIGVGYLEAEFRALGAPFEHRGAVTDEYLAAMRAVWGEAKPAYRGPHPPVVVGGRSAAAFRRAVQHGHGWYGFGLGLDGTKRAVDGLREAATTVARPAALGPLEISITPGRGVSVDLAACEQYAALGVQRLIVMPPAALDADGLERYVETAGKELVGRWGS